MGTTTAYQVTLSTERLRMRRFCITDIQAYLELFQHPQITEFLPKVTDRRAAFRQIAMIEGQWHLVGLSMFAVIDVATNTLIGRAGPWMPDERTEPEVGWCIHPDFQCRGFAAEAARASAQFIFDQHPTVSRVVHHIEERNIASQRTAAKIGAVCTDEIYHHPDVGPLQVWATYRAAFAHQSS